MDRLRRAGTQLGILQSIMFEIARNVWLHRPLLLLALADEVIE